jgi:hypothetical protein
MQKYFVKCAEGSVEYFEIIGETKDGYLVRLTRINDGCKKILEERLSCGLFDICLKTGYIYQAEGATGGATGGVSNAA